MTATSFSGLTLKQIAQLINAGSQPALAFSARFSYFLAILLLMSLFYTDSIRKF
jgi:hypothetical protein